MNRNQLNSGRPLSDYLIGHKFESYLELGILTKDTFDNIDSEKKVGVDMNQKWNPTHLMTTDQFFEINNQFFDLVYIDANHMIDFVMRDYNNSVMVAKKMIAMHDMIPPFAEWTAPHYCGDSYKMLSYLIDHQDEHEFISLNENYGMTFIFPPFKKIDLPKEYMTLSYSDFENKVSSFNLIEKGTAETIISQKLMNKIDA